MTPDRMAAIHAAAFGGAGQVWTASEMAAMLDRPVIHCVTLGADAFAIVQIVPPEAELLTLAVAPAAQGRRIGATLLGQALRVAAQAGATTIFLEVAEDNAPARALYASAGFTQSGRRRRYYGRRTGPPVDAMILTRSLAAEKTGNRRKT